MISLHVEDGTLWELRSLLEQAGYALVPAGDADYHLCRPEKAQAACLRFHDLELYPERYVLMRGTEQTRLSKRELTLLRALMQGGGAVIAKEALFSRAWSYDSQTGVASVEVYMSHLRRKLAGLGSKVGIGSVRGVGYRLIF